MSSINVGDTELRKEVVDSAIKALAKKLYVFKSALTISTTGANKQVFYREASAALVGQSGNAVLGLPRGANFPQASVEWEKVPSWVEKYGLEENIFWEDAISDDIDVQGRTLFKVAEGITNAVDAEIWDKISESQSPTNIFNINITTGAAGNGGRNWDRASAAIIDDLYHAKQQIGQFNYPTNNLIAFISLKDHRSIMKYLTDSGAQYPSIAEGAAMNGNIGKLAGITLRVSNNVTASYALIMVPKLAATWQQATPLTTTTIVDPFKSIKIRAVERGVTQVTTPKAICLISGTQFGA